jgi:hypothetical protein
MGNKVAARRAALAAVAATQDEQLRRIRAHVPDLAAFFTARDRADAVDEWLAEREQALREQAAQRREVERLVCGRALRAMRDRGQSMEEIARMADVSETTARALIREADAAPKGEGAGSPPAAEPRS